MKDVTAPVLEKAEIADYKTVVLTFDEDIADPANDEDVVVKTLLGDNEIDNKAAIALEGTKAIKVTYENSLAAGEYTFTVSGIKDKAETPNEISATAPATIKETKEKSALAKVLVKTTSLPSGYNSTATKYDSAQTNDKYEGYLELAGQDQYGEELALSGSNIADTEITATLGEGENTMPLVIGKGTNNTSLTDGSLASKVYISEDHAAVLIPGKVVNVSIKNTKTKEELGKASFVLKEYQALQAATVKRVVIKDSKGEEVTNLVKNDSYTVSAELLDQNGNEFKMPTSGTTLTWSVSDKDIAGFDTDGSKATYIQKNDTNPTLKANEAGDVTVNVALSDTASASAKLTVNPVALDSISGGDFAAAPTKYNKEEIVSAPITGTAGAVLTADMIHADITGKDADGKELPAPEFTIATKKDAAGNNQIVATIKTSEVGTYKITYYVGKSADDKDAVVAKTEITTEKNPTIAGIQLDTVGENELTENGTVTKALTLTNTNGENINDITTKASLADKVKVYDTKNAADAEETVSAKLQATVDDKDENGKATGYATGITFTQKDTNSLKAGTYYVRIKAGTGDLIQPVQVVSKGTISNINLSRDKVDAIIDDKLDTGIDGKKSDDIVAESGTTYQLVKLDATNQYDKAMKVTVGSGEWDTDHTLKLDGQVVNVTPSDTTYTTIKAFNAEKEIVSTDGAEVKYIGISVATGATVDTTSTVTLEYTNADTTTTSVPITVTNKAERALKSVAVETDVTDILLGNKVQCVMSGVDQYKGVFKLDATENSNDPIKVDGATKVSVIQGDGSNGGTTDELVLNIRPNKTGSQEVTFTYQNDTAHPDKEPNAKVTLNVKAASEITDVKFDGTLNNGSIALPDTNKVYVNDTTNDYIIDASAYAGTTKIAGEASTLFNLADANASVKVTTKDGADSAKNPRINLTDDATGKLKLSLGDADTFDEGDQVDITIYDANTTVTKPIKLHFVISKDTPVITKDITVVNKAADADDVTGAYASVVSGATATIEKTVSGAKKDFSTVLAVQGIDQYGEYKTLVGSNDKVQYSSSNPEVAVIGATDGRVEVKKIGTTTISVKAPNQEPIKVPLTVTADDVEAVSNPLDMDGVTQQTDSLKIKFTNAIKFEGSTPNGKFTVTKKADGTSVDVTPTTSDGKEITLSGSLDVDTEYVVSYSGTRNTDGDLAYMAGSVTVKSASN